MNKKYRNYLVLFAKLCLLAGLVYYIFQRIGSHKTDDLQSAFSVQILKPVNVVYLLIAICLIPLNWILETMKYRSLFVPDRIYTLWESFKIILAGVSFALITPLKLGEYAGRLVLTDKKDRGLSLWATFMGNWCQWVSLGVFGIIGFQIMLEYIKWLSPANIMLVNVLLLLVIALLIYFLFKKLGWMSILLRLIPRRFYSYFKNNHFETYTKHRLRILKACMFAALRYWVYVIQFVLILQFFGVSAGFYICLSAVCTIYFIQLMLPFLNWLGLIGRTGIAIFVLSNVGINEMISGLATLLLWIINMLIPAICGTYFIIQFRRTKIDMQ